MALVQESQTPKREEALADILKVLRERVKRYGECQITTKSLGAIISQRMGRGGTDTILLREFVLGYLTAKGILTFWDEVTRHQSKLVIYQVNINALLHNL